MITIQIQLGEVKYIIERNNLEASQALDDLLNLLFISGVDLTAIEKALSSYKKPENNHKNEKTIQNSSII